MSDLNPAGLEAAAKALSEKLHWLADDERARELAQSSVRAYLSASLPSDAEKNPYSDHLFVRGLSQGSVRVAERAWDEGYAAGLHEENAYPQAWRYGAAEERERWQAMNALLSDQLEEVRRWHLAAVKEKRAAQADAERLFTALDGYIMARITGTDLRDYDDLAERAARAHRALATDVPGKLDRTVLDPETGIEEPVTTGRIPDAEFVEPPLMPPAASPDERLREAATDT